MDLGEVTSPSIIFLTPALQAGQVLSRVEGLKLFGGELADDDRPNPVTPLRPLCRRRRMASDMAEGPRRTPSIGRTRSTLLTRSNWYPKGAPRPFLGRPPEFGSVFSAGSRGCLAMKLAMIGTINEGMKPLGTTRQTRFQGVFGGRGGLCSRLENR